MEKPTSLPSPTAEAIVQDSARASPPPPPPTTASTSKSLSPARKISRPCRGRGKVRAGVIPTSRQTWDNTDVEDIVPTPLAFTPARQTGPQSSSRGAITPLDYFKLFFTDVVLATLLDNINNFGLRKYQDKWTALCLADLYSFLAGVIHTGYKFPFPPSVMSWDKFEMIFQVLQLSALDADEQNQLAKGTPAYNCLAKIKLLYDEMVKACKKHFQPEQSISVNEHMVATTLYIKNKPTKLDYKLFVLADSATGYAWNFFVYEGKSADTEKGLSYESVVKLLDFETLGTGYHLYVDNCYTSPQLFKDLLRHSIGAWGTVRPDQVGFPKAALNDFTRNEPRGNMQWMQDEDLLFVKWKGTREVVMCSTIHTASCKERVKHRMKVQGECKVPIPDTIKDCNKHMGGVDLSDALKHYYTVQHKTKEWYKSFFLHLLDIAIVNAYIIYKTHKEEKEGKKDNTTTMTQQQFREALFQELANHGSSSTSTSGQSKPAAIHLPMYFTEGQDIPKEQAASADRRNCKLCNRKTPVGCTICQVPLCFIPTRNCYRDYHAQQQL